MPTPGHATSPVSPSTCRSSADYQLNFAPRQEAHNNKGPPSVRGWALAVPTHMTTRLLQKPTWLLPALRTVDFHYDDGHSRVRNPRLRDLGNLPRFFLDPSLSVKTGRAGLARRSGCRPVIRSWRQGNRCCHARRESRAGRRGPSTGRALRPRPRAAEQPRSRLCRPAPPGASRGRVSDCPTSRSGSCGGLV